MATFFGSPPFPTYPITRTHHVYSLSQPPPPPPPPDQTPIPVQQLSVTSDELQKQKPATNPKKTSVESTDWIAFSLTRMFGLGAGLAWTGFLAFGVISEQIKTRIEVSNQEANTRDVEKQEEIVLPNGIRTGDLIVLNLKGQVERSEEVFVNTYGRETTKKSLALVMVSRPYSKGMCEGLEYKAGGKRRVIVPLNFGFGEEGADLGSGSQISPSTTLDYLVELDRVSIAPT